MNRLLRVLAALVEFRGGLSVAELTATLHLPASSLRNLLLPLVPDGYLTHDHGRYQLGPAMFRLAADIVSVWEFACVIRPYLGELAARSEESAYLAMLDRAQMVITYVDRVESQHRVRHSVPIGAIRPLYCTAAGRVLLAFADPGLKQEYLRNVKLEVCTEPVTRSRETLEVELDKICEMHIAVSLGEMAVGSGALSAPVFDMSGKTVAAIAIGAPVQRLLPRLEELKSVIADVAMRASGATLRRDLPPSSGSQHFQHRCHRDS